MIEMLISQTGKPGDMVNIQLFPFGEGYNILARVVDFTF